MISRLKKLGKIPMAIISVFLFLMICTGIDDFFKTKEIIDVFLIAVFVLLFLLSIKLLFRGTLKKIKERNVSESTIIPEPEPEPEPEQIVTHVNPKGNNDSGAIDKIEMDLASANVLYETVQTTDDEKLFFLALNEICQILYSLIKYEKDYDFKAAPSDLLNSLNEKRNDLINSLENRIRIANTDINEFAKECNEYESLKDKYDFDNMSGHDFEHFCADVLEKNGFKNVEVTQGSGDHGIDILAEKDDITYAIQCKCYSKDIGNSAVQQAHTGKSIYKKDIAAVMTNRYFTQQAKEEAELLGVKLWDRDKLLSLLEQINKI